MDFDLLYWKLMNFVLTKKNQIEYNDRIIDFMV